ncbi:membrane protein [Streptomyces pseudoechinosporeus]
MNTERPDDDAVREEAEAAQDETVRGEAAQDEAARDEAVVDETVVDEAVRDEPVRPRRRRSVAVASVAAAVLLVGGGGAYFATSASGGGGADDRGGSGTPGGEGDPPPLALDGYTESGTGDTTGIAPGEPDPNGTKYRAEGRLPEGPGSAPVYRTKGEVTAAEVAELAKALGVAGKPTAQGETWRVGAVKDGSGPGLQVSKKAPGTWTYSRSVPGIDTCESTTVCESGATTPDAEVDPVSVDAAKKAAAPVLKAIGQDDAKLDASQLMGTKRVVNAEPEVGGLPTYGWTTGVQIGADGQVVGGSGQLKAPAKGDTYPVLGAEKTLDLLNRSAAGDGRVGIGGCATPVPLEGTENAPCEPSTLKFTPAAVVEDATFGLASQFVDGRQALVPSWLFEVRTEGAEESFTVTHPAVEPRFLTSPGRPKDTPSAPTTPSAKPGEPGDEPSAAPAQRDVRVEGYSADGKKLTVRFTGGVCSDYSASAEEKGDVVTVKVTETPWKDKVCIMIAKTFHKTVELKEPLGDRKVVGTDGKALPLEKDLPKLTK